ncbi:MAG: glycosyl transferase family protein [Spongiibacteraceae bacterium]
MSQQYRNKLAKPLEHEHPFAQYVRILGKGKTGSRSLTREEARLAMEMILNGDVEDVQLGAFLMLLRVKEESHDELTGFVSAAKTSINAPTDKISVDLDWSSYAGKKRQLPWYLLSCFLLADNNIRIFMHGAAGHTIGRLYTENVLQTLNIPIAQSWEQVSSLLDSTQFAFMPLARLCPELKRIIDFRNYLGLRSPVHTLSRLLNPLAAPHSIQSVFHPAYGDSHQQASIGLEQGNAAVFKGEGGEVERKPEASCLVKMVIDGVAHEEIWPKLLDGRQQQPDQLNIRQLIDVWRGQDHSDYANNAIIGTAAIALKLMKKADSQQQALELARQWWDKRNKDRL